MGKMKPKAWRKLELNVFVNMLQLSVTADKHNR